MIKNRQKIVYNKGQSTLNFTPKFIVLNIYGLQNNT